MRSQQQELEVEGRKADWAAGSSLHPPLSGPGSAPPAGGDEEAHIIVMGSMCCHGSCQCARMLLCPATKGEKNVRRGLAREVRGLRV